jgi:porphobilinogen synthase
MASSVVNVPCNVQAIKGLDCQNYFGLKPSRNVKFNCVKTGTTACPPCLFVVRASERHDGLVKKIGLSDAECEAAVVAGNVPEAPPVPPKWAAPAGTPVVPSLVSISIGISFG